MKKSILTIIGLILCLGVFADKVSEKEALGKARQFMSNRTFNSFLSVKHPAKFRSRFSSNSEPAFYVFNADNEGGYVIVSADSRTEEILGYADQGTFDFDHMPEAMERWLEGYASQIAAMGDKQVSSVKRKAQAHSAVAPLIKTTWAQGAPYNLRCPIDDGYQSVTGCVATAMAQVMYYHQWPKTAIPALPAYTTASRGFNMNELPSTTFRWADMKETYSMGESGPAADAVAELMIYCGQAVKMDYTAGASASWITPETFTNLFGYSKTAKRVDRRNYSTSEWESILLNELDNGRPMMYKGSSSYNGGHQFVLDGYDGDGYFHINWGWGGNNNGYFVLSVLNPYDRDTEGGNSDDGFTAEQAAIIGIQPDHGEIAALPDLSASYILKSTSFERSSSSEDFKDVNIYGYLYNYSDNSVTVSTAWELSMDGKRIALLNEQSGQVINAPYGNLSITPQLSFGQGLSDGDYFLRVVYRSGDSDQWHYGHADKNQFVIATISGNNMTLKLSTDLTNPLIVNSVTFSGSKKQGRSTTMNVNVTNNGYANEQTLYLFSEDMSGYETYITVFVEHQESGDVKLYYWPMTSGDKKLRLATDWQGENVIWEGSVSISESYPQNLTVENVDIEGLRNNAIEGNAFKAKFTIKNSGEYKYDDAVCFSLTPCDDNYVFDHTLEIRKFLTVSIEPGEEKTVEVTFDNLMLDQNYCLDFSHYTLIDNACYLRYVWQGDVRTTEKLKPAQLEISSTAVPVLEDGTTVKVNLTAKNIGESDYKERFFVTLFVSNGTSAQYVDRIVVKMDIPVGENRSTDNVVFEGLDKDKTYFIQINYFSENVQVYGCQVEYNPSKATGIDLLMDVSRKIVSILSLDGRKLRSPQKGINIVTYSDGSVRKVLIK